MRVVLAKKDLPSYKFSRKVLYLLMTCIGVIALGFYFKFDVGIIFSDFHYLIDLIGEMLPPNFSIYFGNDTIFFSLIQTLSMAFLATVSGGFLAIFLAFSAASNTTPNKWLSRFLKTAFALERITPTLVILMILLISMGIGPFVGVLSLAIGMIGMFGKLFTNAIEETEKDSLDALYAIGVHKLQVIRFAIFPQVLPSFIANLLFAFGYNLRAAIAFGIFGGSGIGYEINMAIRLIRYKDATALICATVLMILLVENLSNFLRKKTLLSGQLK